MEQQTQMLSRAAVHRYSILALPLAFAGMPLYIHALDYYAVHFGVSLTSLGLVLLLLRLVDAVQDPFIGYLSDAYAHQRKRIIFISAIFLVAGFSFLFQPTGNMNALGWFSLCMLLATTAFSALSINLNTLGGLWSKDAYDKTRITTTREAYGLLGLLLAVVLPSILQQFFTASVAFAITSVILALCMVVALLLFFGPRQSYLHTSSYAASGTSTWFKCITSMPAQMRLFFAGYGLSLLASSIPAILVLIFIRDRLGAEHLTGLFLVLYFLAGAMGMPLWKALSRRKGVYYAWIAAMGLAITSFIWAFLLEEGDVWAYGVICVVSGIAFGADLALPPAILAMHIESQDSKRHASIQFGLLAFTAKAAIALASVITFPYLENAGFVPAGENTHEALASLSMAYALFPSLLKLFAVGVLWFAASYTKEGDFHAPFTVIPHDRGPYA